MAVHKCISMATALVSAAHTNDQVSDQDQQFGCPHGARCWFAL